MSTATKMKFTPSELIWEYAKSPFGDEAETSHATEQDLLALGKQNLRTFVQHWRWEEEKFARAIKDAEADVRVFRGCNAEIMEARARQFEMPTFQTIKLVREFGRTVPEPTDVRSQIRESGSTTFNVCGWCQYSSGGRHAYEYSVASDCRLLETANGDEESDARRPFNTPCLLRNLQRSDYEELERGVEAYKDTLVADKKEIGAKIRYLMRLIRRAEDKPFFPADRPKDWFKIGDVVVCTSRSNDSDYTFVGGVVIGFMHDDRTVVVEHGSGEGGRYSKWHPEVLHQWEFEYLQSHMSFTYKWSGRDGSRTIPDFEPILFSSAITRQDQPV